MNLQLHIMSTCGGNGILRGREMEKVGWAHLERRNLVMAVGSGFEQE